MHRTRVVVCGEVHGLGAAGHHVAEYRMVPVEEAMALFAAYERRNRRPGPVVRVVLSRLLGWRYDGSDSARRKAAEQLPSVAFRSS